MEGWGIYLTLNRQEAAGIAQKDWSESAWILTVRIHADEQDFMLWNKPVTARQHLIKRLPVTPKDGETGMQVYHRITNAIRNGSLPAPNGDTPAERASKLLLSRGIVGVRYGDQYVVYDENAVQIIGGEELLSWQDRREGKVPAKFTVPTDPETGLQASAPMQSSIAAGPPGKQVAFPRGKSYIDLYEEGEVQDAGGGGAASPRQSYSGTIRTLARLLESQVRNQEPKARITYHRDDAEPDFTAHYDSAGQLHVSIHSEVYAYLHFF